MIAQTKLPIALTSFSCTDASHYRDYIDQVRASGIIPDIESLGLAWRVTSADTSFDGTVDQRLPVCAQSVMRLSGGSIMYLT